MFFFYTSWKPYVEMMDCEETKRFINNLINYTEGNEIELITQTDKLVWIGVQPLLDNNEEKRQRVIERNRNNGTKGGAPVGNSNAKKTTQNNPTVDNTTQNNPNQPKQPEEGRRMNEEEERGRKNEDGGLKTVDVESRLLKIMKNVIDDGSITKEEVINWKMKDTRELINYTLSDYSSWENDLFQLGSESFLRKLPTKSSVEVNYLVHSLIKAHEIL